jgi:hypothetical protein
MPGFSLQGRLPAMLRRMKARLDLLNLQFPDSDRWPHIGLNSQDEVHGP